MKTTQSTIPLYVVMTAKAKMPSSCWGDYGRVAVVRTDGVRMPKQIHPGHNAVRGIAKTWEKLNRGGPRSAYQIALREARDLADRLNGRDASLISSEL